MSEKFTDELISAYLDGELSASQQSLVEQKLAESVEYQKMFDEMKALRDDIQGLPTYQLDADFSQRIIARISSADDPVSVSAPRPYALSRTGTATRNWKAAVALLTTVAATLLFSMLMPLETIQNRQTADVNESPDVERGGESIERNERRVGQSVEFDAFVQNYGTELEEIAEERFDKKGGTDASDGDIHEGVYADDDDAGLGEREPTSDLALPYRGLDMSDSDAGSYRFKNVNEQQRGGSVASEVAPTSGGYSGGVETDASDAQAPIRFGFDSVELLKESNLAAGREEADARYRKLNEPLNDVDFGTTPVELNSMLAFVFVTDEQVKSGEVYQAIRNQGIDLQIDENREVEGREAVLSKEDKDQLARLSKRSPATVGLDDMVVDTLEIDAPAEQIESALRQLRSRSMVRLFREPVQYDDLAMKSGRREWNVTRQQWMDDAGGIAISGRSDSASFGIEPPQQATGTAAPSKSSSGRGSFGLGGGGESEGGNAIPSEAKALSRESLNRSAGEQATSDAYGEVGEVVEEGETDNLTALGRPPSAATQPSDAKRLVGKDISDEISSEAQPPTRRAANVDLYDTLPAEVVQTDSNESSEKERGLNRSDSTQRGRGGVARRYEAITDEFGNDASNKVEGNTREVVNNSNFMIDESLQQALQQKTKLATAGEENSDEAEEEGIDRDFGDKTQRFLDRAVDEPTAEPNVAQPQDGVDLPTLKLEPGRNQWGSEVQDAEDVKIRPAPDSETEFTRDLSEIEQRKQTNKPADKPANNLSASSGPVADSRMIEPVSTRLTLVILKVPSRPSATSSSGPVADQTLDSTPAPDVAPQESTREKESAKQ